MASIWKEPIFDRTSEDVATAIRKIREWKEGHTHAADIELNNESVISNEGEVSTTKDSVVLETDGVTYIDNDVLVVQLGTVYDLKGCLNLSDLNRIEDDIEYLAERLMEYRYPVTVNCKEWVKSDLPNALDMKRIANNIRLLFAGFATPSEYSPIPEVMLSYKDINAIERNLYLLKQMIDVMQGSFIISGTYKSGATNRLPLRR